MIYGGQSIPEKVQSDLVNPRDETKIVLKSLDKMFFTNSLCNTLALICAIQPLPNQHPYRLQWKELSDQDDFCDQSKVLPVLYPGSPHRGIRYFPPTDLALVAP